MLAASIPVKFPIPFANAADPADIRPVPQASQIGIQDGAASLTDGFPPINFIPVGAGGVPPFGQDFNGLLYQISAWNQWQAAGGPVKFDATFSTAIGGYPNGAEVLSATTAGLWWRSTADNNTTNPDSGGAGWTALSGGGAAAQYGVAGGTANALTLTVAPAIPSYGAGQVFFVLAAAPNTNAVTLNVSGKGAKAIVSFDGTALTGGEIVGGQVLELAYDGTRFIYLNGPNSPTPTAGDNSTRNATTAFVTNAVNTLGVYRYLAATTATALLPLSYYVVNTLSAAITAPLPATPVTGDILTFLDSTASWENNNLTLGRNGNTIMGDSTDLICRTPNLQFSIWWNGSDWRLV